MSDPECECCGQLVCRSDRCERTRRLLAELLAGLTPLPDYSDEEVEAMRVRSWKGR